MNIDYFDLTRKYLKEQASNIEATNYDIARTMIIKYQLSVTYDHLSRYVSAIKKEIIEKASDPRFANRKDFSYIKQLPNILLLDIETTPMEVFVWGLYKQRINPSNVIEDWNMLSWAAKWLYSPEILSDVLTPKESVNRNDKRILESLWTLIEQADMIIAHNGIRFDMRKINARFKINGLPRPSTYKVIDTLLMSRKIFAFSSHKLDYLGQMLLNKGKIETDFQLWIDCLAGKQEALDYMVKYNEEDVNLLEEVYMELRGWMPSHPNLALHAEVDEPVCPTCMSTDVFFVGDYGTPAGIYNSLRCGNCGSIMRQRKSALTPKKRDLTYISTAR